MMFVPLTIQPNSVEVLKVKRSLLPKNATSANVSKDYKLEIMGSSPEGEAVFKYSNLNANISQRFGFSLKHYKAHLQLQAQYEDRKVIPNDKLTERVIRLHDASDGAYVFLPEIEDDGF